MLAWVIVLLLVVAYIYTFISNLFVNNPSFNFSILSSVLGWPKSPFSFFHKIKDTLFIFTNNFIDLDILSVLAISHVVEC